MIVIVSRNLLEILYKTYRVFLDLQGFMGYGALRCGKMNLEGF